MQYGKYLFSNKLQDEAILPAYKGSTFRGVLGHALKKVACALKIETCQDCLLREKCVYAFLYETPSNTAAIDKARVAAPPHPYVIEPPRDARTHFRKGEKFDFSLLLFGKANDYIPYFIYALQEMGRLGIGKHVDGKRGAFTLQSVSAGEDIVYSCEDDKLRSGNFLHEVTISADNGAEVRAVEMALLTPLRLKYQNSLEARLPFHILVRAMLRRISTLYNYYGNGEPALDYRGLVERAVGIEMTRSSLHWFDWKRYSNRQEQSMLMGGMIGNITYEGDLTEFLPLLQFCEVVHVGKQTSFGLGKFSLSAANRTDRLDAPADWHGGGTA